MSPKVIFGVNNLRLELIALEIVWKNNRSLWKTFLLQHFPVFSEVKNWNTKTIKGLAAGVYEERKDEIVKASQLFREWWSPLEQGWFLFLEDIFELKIGMMSFKAAVGISPISPRNLEEESFLVPFYTTRQNLIRLCAHETSHFYFYRKIKKMNPFLKRKIIISSGYLWLLSEMLVPLMLDDPKVINAIGKTDTKSYVCKSSPPTQLKILYNLLTKKKIDSKDFFEKIMKIKIHTSDLNQKLILHTNIDKK